MHLRHRESLHRHAFFAVAWLTTVGLATAIGEENSPRFRGVDGTGVAQDDPRLPDTWSTESNVAWSADVPGLAWSCPTVWNNRLFVTSVTSDGDQPEPQAGLYLGQGVREPEEGVHHWLVFCFDVETGQELWRREAAAGPPSRICCSVRCRTMAVPRGRWRRGGHPGGATAS